MLGNHSWGAWAKVDYHLEKKCSRDKCNMKRVKYPPAGYVLVKGLLCIAEKMADRYFDEAVLANSTHPVSPPSLGMKNRSIMTPKKVT